MHPHPFSTARFFTQRLSHTHLRIHRQHRDGSFALNRLLLPGGEFSHRVEDSSVSSREAPLVLSGPRPVLLRPLHTCLCMYVSRYTRSPLPFAASRSFVYSVPRSRRKANSGKRRRQGVAAISRTTKRLFGREISPTFLRRHWRLSLSRPLSGLKYLEAKRLNCFLPSL